MMDYGSATTWPEPDSTWMGVAEDLTYRAPSMYQTRKKPTWSVAKKRDTSAFMVDFHPAPAPAMSDSSALPGELLTPEVTQNLSARRTLKGVFFKLAQDGAITAETLASLTGVIEALPTRKQLPVVAPDGEGGLTLAWHVAGQGRTLITVLGGVLYPIARAGTPQSVYFDEAPADRGVPQQLLAVIPE
jgi:hypothetical protein